MAKEKTTGYRQVTMQAFGFADTGAQQSNIIDPFGDLYGTGPLSVIEPPLYPDSLLRMPGYSKILPQCIRAMATNVHGYGWELEMAPHLDKKKDPPAQAQEEKRRLESLFGYINTDGQNFTLLSQDMQSDKETLGYAYIEVVRNGKGEVAEMYLMPAYQMRMANRDKEATEFTQLIRDDKGQYQEEPRAKKFRRFVQIANGKKVYFKELGDPRLISSADGEEYKTTVRPATEILMFKHRCGYSPYGIPRWEGQLLSILGARKSEEINYAYFDNKAIPPLVVMISGGAMTSASAKALKELFEREIKGISNFHKALILEAIPFADVGEVGGEKFGRVQIDIKPLTEFMQKDALFMEYGKENVRMVRSSFQLPPIYVGLSDDYTRATALESVGVAETQVFKPERNAFAYQINSTVMADLGINNWTFNLRSPKTSDYPTIVNALAAIQQAISVGTLQEAGAELLGKPTGDIDPEWYKLPLGMLATGATMDFEPGEVQAMAKFVGDALKERERLVKQLKMTDDEVDSE